MKYPVISDQEVLNLMARIPLVRADSGTVLRRIRVEDRDINRSCDLRQCDLGTKIGSVRPGGSISIFAPLMATTTDYRVILSELYAQLRHPILPNDEKLVQHYRKSLRGLSISDRPHMLTDRNAIQMQATLWIRTDR
jgi:hypothetical protein